MNPKKIAAVLATATTAFALSGCEPMNGGSKEPSIREQIASSIAVCNASLAQSEIDAGRTCIDVWFTFSLYDEDGVFVPASEEEDAAWESEVTLTAWAPDLSNDGQLQKVEVWDARKKQFVPSPFTDSYDAPYTLIEIVHPDVSRLTVTTFISVSHGWTVGCEAKMNGTSTISIDTAISINPAFNPDFPSPLPGDAEVTCEYVFGAQPV